MTINENLDIIDDLLDSAWTLPLSGGRCVVDIDKIREAIDDIRLNMPTEIKQAKMIVADRTQIITDARKEADTTVKIAEERAKKLVETSEIVHQSQDRAKEIMTQTNIQARDLKRATNDYIETALKNCEDNLASVIQDVKATRQALRAPKNRQPQQQPAPAIVPNKITDDDEKE